MKNPAQKTTESTSKSRRGARAEQDAPKTETMIAEAPETEAPDEDEEREEEDDEDEKSPRPRVRLTHPDPDPVTGRRPWVRMFADQAYAEGFERDGKWISGTPSPGWPHTRDGRPFVPVNGRGETRDEESARRAERARIRALPLEERRALKMKQRQEAEKARAERVVRLMETEGITLAEALQRTL